MNVKRERVPVIPVSVNLVTYFSSPPDRCAWPLPPFSITAGSDPFRRYLFSLSLPPYQSLCHLSLHTSGVRDQHHPSAFRERGRERRKKKRLLFKRFRSKRRLKVTERLLKPQWLPHTNTPTHTQLNGTLIFSFFHPSTSTLTMNKHPPHMVRLDHSLVLFD